MSTVGKNLKITVANENRALTRSLFTEVLGCTMKSPTERLDIFAFQDGYSLGAFYGDASEMLKGDEHKKGPWLEFAVDDLDKAQSQLRALGIEPFDYQDKSHNYYCPTCGPVFRLAKRA